MSSAPNDPGIPVLTEVLDLSTDQSDFRTSADLEQRFFLPDSALTLPDEPVFSWPAVIAPRSHSTSVTPATVPFECVIEDVKKPPPRADSCPSMAFEPSHIDGQAQTAASDPQEIASMERRIWAALESRLTDTLDARLERNLARAVEQALADAIDELKLNLRETARQLVLEAVRSELKNSLPSHLSTDTE